MGLFHSKSDKSEQRSFSVQTGSQSSHPYFDINTYTPMSNYSGRIYASLREAVPIIDSAIFKIVRLVGGFSVETGNKATDEFLKTFLNNINVGGNMVGIDSFISSYLEQLLTFGSAIGEMVVSGSQLVALYNGELDALDVKRNDNGIDVDFFNSSYSLRTPVKYPKLILFSVLNPEPGKILGTSILKGLPFISDILLKIYNTIGTNWERVGNLRYAVTYKPQNDSTDRAFAKERASQMAQQWKNAMESKETVKDFVAVGDVEVKVIGADNQILDSEIPVRQLLEQIVAKTGLPPYMFGLSWSTTERMSAQQADILTTELESYRRILTPVIKKIADTVLVLNGMNEKATVVWSNITLQDQTELAKARLYNAQADKIIKGDEA